MADITDGTSSTVIFGESLTPTGVWALATSSSVRTNIDRTINKPILYNGLNYYTYWMSKHPSMVNFAKRDAQLTGRRLRIVRPRRVRRRDRDHAARAFEELRRIEPLGFCCARHSR